MTSLAEGQYVSVSRHCHHLGSGPGRARSVRSHNRTVRSSLEYWKTTAGKRHNLRVRGISERNA